MTKCVRQHKVIKGGKLQKSESSLICVIIAEGLAGEEEELANFCWAPRQSLHSQRHGDQCWEIQADDNTSGINTEVKVNGQEAWDSHKL